MEQKIYIVIAVHNRLKFTRDCLQSLQNQTYRNFQIILVDDGSIDGTAEYIQSFFPNTIIEKGDGNLWWAGATNLAVQKALSLSQSADDYILTLNNDLIVGPDYLSELLLVAKNEFPCITGSVCVNIRKPNEVVFAGLKWNRITAKYSRTKLFHENYSQLVQNSPVIETDLLPGRGTLIPLSLFQKIGLFDSKNFPQYAADDDFSLRGRKSGYRLVVATKAVVKSHIDLTGVRFGGQQSGQPKNLNNLREALGSIRSVSNLQIRYKWAKKHTPIPPLYFLFDFMRVMHSFYFK